MPFFLEFTVRKAFPIIFCSITYHVISQRSANRFKATKSIIPHTFSCEP